MLKQFIYPIMLLALWALSGCSTGRYQTSQCSSTDHNIVLLDGDMAASQEWKAEAQRRFKDPIIVTVHGRTVAGQWYCFPQCDHEELRVETLAQSMHRLHPDNDIVLIVCNADGHEIHVPHVWYARQKVWMRPTASLYPWERAARQNSPIVGDIWKFYN